MPRLPWIHWRGLSLSQQYMLASFVILVSSMAVIGWWVGNQIKNGVVDRVASATALYVDSIIDPYLHSDPGPEADVQRPLAPESIAGLDELLQNSTLGRELVVFKVWRIYRDQGYIVYSTDAASTGQSFPVKDELARAWQGEVVADISNLEDEENVRDRKVASKLLEIYSPVRQNGTNRVVAVVEFYYPIGALEDEIAAAERRSWLVVIVATLVTYLLLAGIVRRGSNTIANQGDELKAQVAHLTTLTSENRDLNERVRRAAAQSATVNERYLRRISSELHDGPAQDLGLALLRLDDVIASNEHCSVQSAAICQAQRITEDDLLTVQDSLRRALQDLRATATGLRLPELRDLPIAEAIKRVARLHERRTGTTVVVSVDDCLPDTVSLPAKITVYRLSQEALNNAYRHAGGLGQEVRLSCDGRQLTVEVLDRGPGFDTTRAVDEQEHLGVAGMRERVESLGGIFQVESTIGKGTRVFARVPLDHEEMIYG